MNSVEQIIESLGNTNFSLHQACSSLSLDEIVLLAKTLNDAYRQGNPLVSDNDYDHVVIARLEALDPENEFLNTVEDEGGEGAVEGKVTTLPKVMLSTNKAYSKDKIDAWLNRILKSAGEIGVEPNEISLRVTPKLDGFASYDDGQKMYTRGNGIRGTDISYVINHGLTRYRGAERGMGAGEIVVVPEYFEENLSGEFSNTRNVISGVLRTKPEPIIQQAIQEGGVVFAPFASLDAITCSMDELNDNYDAIVEKARNSVNFDIDGVIIEVTNDAIKTNMGATQKAHRWMIALKENEAPVSIKVLSVTAQTSRKGRVVPVCELEPTVVTGVTVSRVTGHNYTNIKNNSIGKGSVIKLVRSGLVIPKIVGVEKSTEADMPSHCPSCNEALVWGNEADGTEMDLICENTEACPAQAQKRLLHWFTTLENIDGFGPNAIKVLADAGISTVPDIYAMDVAGFTALGFGNKTASNLVNELNRSRQDAVEDYRFLAGFGIRTLGKSMSETILSHHRMDDLFSLTADELIAIDKVGKTKANCIVSGLRHIKGAYNILKNEMGFNLIETALESEKEVLDNPFAGKTVVFTGTMQIKSRSDMTKQAKAFGASVGSSVTSKTDYLIIGEKVGASKTNAAKKHGTTILTEDEYTSMLGEYGL